MSKPQPQSQSQPHSRPKKRRTHKAKMGRIIVSIPDGLLDLVDKAAKEDYTTRSDIIRTAIRWYLRPQGRDLAETDPDFILKTLERRQALVGIKQMLKDAGLE